MIVRNRLVGGLVAVALGLSACGGGDDASTPEDTTDVVATEDAPAAATGIRVVPATEAAATLESPPDDLVVLDVRTAEEFSEGHLDGAVMLDFYSDDFAEQIAQLDRDVPYVIYCRSGNRSGQTRALMDELGFSAVDDVEGGIISWVDAGLTLVDN